MQIFQLQAIGLDLAEIGTGHTKTIYNSVVFATKSLAEKRIDKFRSAVADRIDHPTITIIPIDVIMDDDSNDLPESYIPSSYGPTSIERRNEVVYAAGYEEKPGSFGMYDGPTPSLFDLLESIPCSANPCIIRFNLDGTEDILYRWNSDKNEWRLAWQKNTNLT